MDDNQSITTVVVLLVIAAVLIIFSMIFSASESAYLSINRLRIRFLRNKKNKRALRVDTMLNKKARLLNTVLIANNIVNIAVSSILTYLALHFFGPAGVGIATIVATLLLLIFGEITPKTIAINFPERIALIFSPLISFAVFILTPLERVFTFFSQGVSNILQIKIPEKNVSFTEEEIKTFFDVGEEEGILDAGEKKMLKRAFRFTGLSAKEIMTPRTQITAIPVTASIPEVIKTSQDSHFSRFPVYEKDIDNIIGIVYIKDFLFSSKENTELSLKDTIRSPLFILENKKIPEIQALLQENNQNMAVILDEYSGTAGLLTMEDLSEEIFGSIVDEHDCKEEETFTQTTENEMIVEGTMRLSDIQEQMQINLESEFYDTIAGYITEKLGEIPLVGAKLVEEGLVFTVLETDSTRILRVHISKEESV